MTTDEGNEMTTTDETTPPTPEQPADTGTTTTDETEAGKDSTATASREAARYRRQLRNTEAERDQLRQQVDALRKAEVERLADRLAQPSALWATTELADLLDDAGQVDETKVATAVEEARTTLGLATVSGTPAPATEGRTMPVPSGPRWAGAFAPPQR